MLGNSGDAQDQRSNKSVTQEEVYMSRTSVVEPERREDQIEDMS